MDSIVKIKMIYIFGELEADYKKLKEYNWLNEDDMAVIKLEFERIKVEYQILIEIQFDREESEELNRKMKNMPMYITFSWNKEKFISRFEEWKRNLENPKFKNPIL